MIVFLSSDLQEEQFVLQLVADQRVERRERLVHEQDVGVGREGARETDALLHAAGKFMAELAGPLREAHHRELVRDDLVDLRFRQCCVIRARMRRSP